MEKYVRASLETHLFFWENYEGACVVSSGGFPGRRDRVQKQSELVP